MAESEPDPAEPDPAEHEATEHDPVESARPTIGRRDEPDALRPDVDDRHRPHRTLPPEPEEAGSAARDRRPAEPPAPSD